MKSKSNKCLILGMSHIEAIRQGIPPEKADTVQLINLNDCADVYSRESNVLNLESINNEDVKHLFLSIGGNYYNIFGLIDNSVPFTVCSEITTVESFDESRKFIPRQMMMDHFKIGLQRLLKHIPVIKNHFPNTVIYHLCSPPPVESVEHITQFPGIFRSRLAQGITPSSIRKVLYDIQTEIYEQECKHLDIKVIPPPTESTDENGFLQSSCRSNDPTHANNLYGSLVWSQIEAHLDA